jgi:inorganic pyrophosphatase
MFVDRFMSTAMHYPCNYGYIPKTLADDGDPVDVLVITPVPLIPGVVVTCRPLGMLKMEDEAGATTSCWPCPPTRSCRSTAQWQKPEDLNPLRLKTIAALLRALQGPGARQVGQDPGLGRRRCRQEGNHGRHRQLSS